MIYEPNQSPLLLFDLLPLKGAKEIHSVSSSSAPSESHTD
jgi:hypothetical protein